LISHSSVSKPIIFLPSKITFDMNMDANRQGNLKDDREFEVEEALEPRNIDFMEVDEDRSTNDGTGGENEDANEVMSVDSANETDLLFVADNSSFSGLVSCWSTSPDKSRTGHDELSRLHESFASDNYSFPADSSAHSGIVSCWSSSPEKSQTGRGDLSALHESFESTDTEDSDDGAHFRFLLFLLSNIGRLQELESQKATHNVRVQYNRISWISYWDMYRNDPDFERVIRMKRESFVRLVDLLRSDLAVDQDMADKRGGQVSPEMCVYMTLRYLAGAPDIDVKQHISVSGSTFYQCLHKTLRCICKCASLDILFPKSLEDCNKLAAGFLSCTSKGSIINCVGALDGFLLCIDTPSESEAKNQRSFFSGHYQRNGVNIQAICDSNKMFLYFAVTGPGSMGDRMAMHENICDQGTLSELVEKLPGKFVVIADAAYEATEKVVPMFYGVQKYNELHDNFNYAASCCRIRLEQAFGHMTNKWRILHRPLYQRLHNVKLVAVAIARLHNFCIREKLESDLLGDDRSYDFIAGSSRNTPYYHTLDSSLSQLS
jgi:DDE superfamily endonuclease